MVDDAADVVWLQAQGVALGNRTFGRYQRHAGGVGSWGGLQHATRRNGEIGGVALAVGVVGQLELVATVSCIGRGNGGSN